MCLLLLAPYGIVRSRALAHLGEALVHQRLAQLLVYHEIDVRRNGGGAALKRRRRRGWRHESAVIDNPGEGDTI